MRTDKELKQLAVDISDGLVFTDRHFSEIQLADGEVKRVFLPIMLGKGYTPEQVESGEVAMIYEYMSKSGKSMNSDSGLPSFMSYEILNQAEVSKLSEYIAIYEQMKDGHIEMDINFVD